MSKKVTETSLLWAFKGVEDSTMEAMRNGENTGHDVYEVRPRKGGDGVDLVSDRFRRGPIWYAGADAVRTAVAYAKYRSFSRQAIIRVLDDSGAVIHVHTKVGSFLSERWRYWQCN